jgi:hypothetical protein
MDIVSLVRAQMLSALFSTLDQSVKDLIKPGESAPARVIKAPDQNGVLTVSIKGQPVALSVRNDGAPAPAQQQGRPALDAEAEALLRPGRVLLVERSLDGEALLLKPTVQPRGESAQAGAALQLHPTPKSELRPSPALIQSSEALAMASLKQQSLGKVFAEIGEVVRTRPDAANQLPQAAKQTLNLILSAQIDGDAPVLPDALRKVLAIITGHQNPRRKEYLGD